MKVGAHPRAERDRVGASLRALEPAAVALGDAEPMWDPFDRLEPPVVAFGGSSRRSAASIGATGRTTGSDMRSPIDTRHETW